MNPLDPNYLRISGTFNFLISKPGTVVSASQGCCTIRVMCVVVYVWVIHGYVSVYTYMYSTSI